MQLQSLTFNLEASMDEHCKHDANKRVLMIHSWDPNVGRETGDRLTLVAARFPEAAATKAMDRSSTAVIDGDGLGRHASTKEALSMAMLGCTVKS